MSRTWRLTRHAGLWTSACPVLACLGAWLERTGFTAVAASAWPARLTWAAMLLWAAWIYLRVLPRRAAPWSRAAALLGYALAMAALAWVGLALGMVLVALIWGI